MEKDQWLQVLALGRYVAFSATLGLRLATLGGHFNTRVWVSRSSHGGVGRRGQSGRKVGEQAENKTFFRSWGDREREDTKGRHNQGWICCSLSGAEGDLPS